MRERPDHRQVTALPYGGTSTNPEDAIRPAFTAIPSPEPVRVPAAAIDTLWTRGYSTKTGGIRSALWAVSLGGGTVAGGLVGMLIGAAVPRWNQRFP